MKLLVFIICGFPGNVIETLTALTYTGYKNTVNPAVCVLGNDTQVPQRLFKLIWSLLTLGRWWADACWENIASFASIELLKEGSVGVVRAIRSWNSMGFCQSCGMIVACLLRNAGVCARIPCEIWFQGSCREETHNLHRRLTVEAAWCLLKIPWKLYITKFQ